VNDKFVATNDRTRGTGEFDVEGFFLIHAPEFITRAFVDG
jgi:hypothetical protein